MHAQAPTPTPTPSPPPPQQQQQSQGSKRTYATLASHTHLGLRPKSPDSLHARIRSTHPQPKHISRIEDIVGSDTSSVQRSASIGSLVDEHGIASAYEASASRLRKLNGQRIKDASVNGSAHASGSSSPLSSQRASVSDLGQHSAEHSARSSVIGQQDLDDVFDVVYDDNADMETTDIGIYRDEVYDEYLGPVMGTLRRMLVRSLMWESPILARHQRFVRTRHLDRFFVYTSLMGSHSFFLIFLPTTYWFVNGCFARGLVNVLAAGVYFSSAIKDALCIPRPYSPPVTRLVIGTTHLEYGFLSTHCTNCISIVMYVYLWLRAIREHLDATSPLQSKGWEIGLVFYAVSVVYGRIYSGMHSMMDCVMGCILGAIITWAQWRLTEPLEYVMSFTSVAVPILVNSIGIGMVMVHPQPLDDCPCFEDAIAFLSVVMGIVTGRWASVRFSLAPLVENPLMRDLHATVDSAQLGPVASFAESLKPMPVYWYAFHLLRVVLVLVLGVGTVLATRVTVKTVCRVVLPPIFRFVQGNLGFVLPRRHYTSSTDYAAMQAQHQDASQDFTPPQSVIVLQPVATNTATAHKRTASWIPREAEHFERQSEIRNGRSRSQSVQDGSGAFVGSNQVKFTLGDGKDLQVPFTHPNTNLPGDAFSERIAGALSAEERARQHFEGDGGHKRAPSGASLRRTTSAEGSALRRHDNTGDKTGHRIAVQYELQQPDAHSEQSQTQPNDDVQIRHYDVDVLTKVFVYHAIGFVSSCVIPVAFERVGLL